MNKQANILFRASLFKIIIVLFASILFSSEAFSSHAAGMDITYKFVGASGQGREITVNVGGGSWQSEVSWNIVDPSSGTILASGGAPYSGTLCIPSSNLGNLQFITYDSWGDGWNGCTYTISGNGTLSGATTGTLNNGYGPGINNFSITGGTSCTIPETLKYEITLAFYMDCENANSFWSSPPYNSIDIKYEKNRWI